MSGLGSGIILKPGKEKALLSRHPWIFSGAIASAPEFENGDILPVYSFSNELLAYAYFHRENSIAGRILSFGAGDPLQVLSQKLEEAVALRRSITETNAVRLVNAEGDGIPGLVVDRYKDVLVLQASTYGIEKLKAQIVDILVKLLNPRSIYEKSVSPARRQEGLANATGVLFGELVSEVTIAENGIDFIVSIVDGQKTGFFLDQREMRKAVGALSAGKKVLNCFAYSGGFSLYAQKGGASRVDSVEISADACALGRRNGASNMVQADAFEFLKEDPLDYGLIILDPPAFAKKRSDVEAACSGYKEINRLVMEKAPKGAILVTCSCSSHMDDELFKNILFKAALAANRPVRIIGRHIQAPDHPISIYHPEGNYLKSFILQL